MSSKLFFLISTACLSVLFLNPAYALNKAENSPSYILGTPNQASMLAPAKSADSKTQTFILPATPATTQWGTYNSSEPPVLKIKSGDTVIIETMTASNNQVVPGGATAEQIVQMKDAEPNRGPHTITGPIYVEGAEPGDVLKIHINKIVPRPYASNDIVPGKGLFPEEFPKAIVKYFYLDLSKMQMQFAPGIVVPLKPFPGVVAVARAKSGKFNTIPPGPYGGNMDMRELTQGTTLYLPVFKKGALLWTGDSHAAQGNGEIDLTAAETAFAEFNITVSVLKNRHLEWPRVETPTAWIAMGYDKNLNAALDIATQQTVKMIMDLDHVSEKQAEKILQDTWNCPISEVVNGIQGVYCVVPKDKNATKAFPLANADNAKDFVTHATNPDLEVAMKTASMDMLNKIVKDKGLSKVDAYMLASFAMDCRIAPYTSGDKSVYCMMSKSLWVSK